MFKIGDRVENLFIFSPDKHESWYLPVGAIYCIIGIIYKGNHMRIQLDYIHPYLLFSNDSNEEKKLYALYSPSRFKKAGPINSPHRELCQRLP